MNLLSLPQPASIEGHTLIPLIASATPLDNDIIYAETFQPFLDYHWAPLFTIIHKRKKFIDAPNPEFYDLNNDFNELHNLSNANEQNFTSWKSKLNPFINTLMAKSKIDSASREALASLGYAGGTNASSLSLPQMKKLPDPKNKISVLESIHDAMDNLTNNNDSSAYEILSAIKTKDPNNVRVLYLLSIISNKKNDYKNAVDYMKKAAALNPDYLAPYYLLSADIAIKHKKFQEAEKYYLETIKVNPFEYSAYNNLAQIAFMNRNYSKATEYLTSAVELSPENLEIRNNLGILLLNENKLNEAEALFLTNLQISPKHQITLMNLAIVYMKKKEYNKAFSFIRQLLELDSNNENYYLLMIDCCSQASKTNELINYRLKLADLFIKKGQTQKAILQLQEILKIDHSHPDARKKIEQLLNK
ncbi:MAG: hypothetical protein A2Y62_07875 [Candidatus Fischerbacteria bacterium RBG_13_37_8]|uniref:UDP-N-acetylglucosamine--peptide N-acetylglucosaminyltransferase SPINDLY n=1 Tax=Candidatus Fischerbacteria bacterium RBG_13_37_8 TaxID=1817863 RepID=A0A1F5VAK5_9BACT|nr:MAG: hypothetical protein A2Y62_07875 [Candidatus Fischerbacteria bacterium RBG_13_37_8]